MRVLTTTLCYPTPQHPDRGVFVERRAIAIARQPDVKLEVAAPQPWCPVVRAGAIPRPRYCPLPVSYPIMLSAPVLGWALDGLAYAHALAGFIRSREASGAPGVDLIDAHFEYPDGVGAWWAGRRLNLPVVVTVRGKIVSLSRRAIRRMQIAAMLRGVDARIAVSGSLSRWIRRIGGDDLFVHVVPNGVDPAAFNLVDRVEARDAIGWRRDARYVLAVGHQQYVKGFDRLLDVVSDVRRSVGEVRFVLVGSRRGERGFRRRLQRTAGACNAGFASGDEPVQFIDPVSAARLNLLYNAADILVCPSRSEGWCNAISEALAAGTPVVATDVGGNAEQVCSPELGMLTRDGDICELAATITAALSREWNRVLISAHGSARSWSQVAAEVYQVFQSVLARRAVPRDRALRGQGRLCVDTRPEVAS